MSGIRSPIPPVRRFHFNPKISVNFGDEIWNLNLFLREKVRSSWACVCESDELLCVCAKATKPAWAIRTRRRTMLSYRIFNERTPHKWSVPGYLCLSFTILTLSTHARPSESPWWCRPPFPPRHRPLKISTTTSTKCVPVPNSISWNLVIRRYMLFYFTT